MGNFDDLFKTNKAFSHEQVEGRDYYVNEQGYRVMTREFLTKRGYFRIEKEQYQLTDKNDTTLILTAWDST